MDLSPNVVGEVVKELVKPMVGGILGLVRKMFRRSGKAGIERETAETPEPVTYRQSVKEGSAGAQGPGANATVNHNYAPGGKPPRSPRTGGGPS